MNTTRWSSSYAHSRRLPRAATSLPTWCCANQTDRDLPPARSATNARCVAVPGQTAGVFATCMVARLDERSMRRSPRPSPPSAIDGYKRLNRGAGVSQAHQALAAGVDGDGEGVRRGRSATARRAVGALRMAGLVASVCVIVGASVALAGTDTPHPRTTRHDATPRRTTDAQSRTAATAHVAPAARVTSAAAKVETSTVRAPSSPLPFTGDRMPLAISLAGGLLVVLGMFVQISVQPLPSTRRNPHNAR